MSEKNQPYELQLALDIVLSYGWNATSFQIVNPGIALWFSAGGDAVVGYVEHYGVRVVAGAPVCAEERLAEVVLEFENDALVHNLRVCYFGAEHRLESLLHNSRKHSSLVLGAQPAWNPADWPDMLSRHTSLRAQLNRARNKGVRVRQWSQEQACDNPDLQRILEEWLDTRGLPPLHFLVEPQTLGRLFTRSLFVAERDDDVVGFLVASPVPLRNGFLIEQIVRSRNTPNGTVELMLDAALQRMIELGSSYVTLGLSPISRRAGVADSHTPPWLRSLLAFIRAYGRRFYNFDGLDAFKAKFRPQRWEPVYAIANEPHMSIRILYATAAAFAGESPLRTLARALVSR